MLFDDLPFPSSSNRAQLEKVVLAQKAGAFLCEEKPDGERQVVENVARSLANDISREVRQTLAFELRRADRLPRDLAERIARDVEEVSGPFLTATEVFSPDELALLARELEEHGRVAIARRSHVPAVVAMAIADVGGERSVGFLVRNKGAEMVADACDRVVERFGGSSVVMDYMAERPDLPLDIIHRLVDRVSESCRSKLVCRYGLDEQVAASAAGSAQAASLVRWVKDATRGRLNEYIRQLESRGALTDRLLADITRRGGVRLFESTMSYKTGIDVDQVEALMRKAAPEHLTKLLRKAGYRDERAHRLLAAALEGLQHRDVENV